jgi:hypothetical protein
MTVAIHIDELVLDGLGLDSPDLAATVAAQLERVLAERGLAPGIVAQASSAVGAEVSRAARGAIRP